MKKHNSSKRLILLSLNEINFEIAKLYSNKYNFIHINKLYSKEFLNFQTSSEKEYDKLEPWIQWVSVYTGMSADEHGIFRLGDVVNNSTKQIFEKIEKMNYKVGSISPMNASNQLASPSFFIPDPWTQTKSDNSFWSKIISKVLSETVNQNAKNKIKFSNFASLILIFLKFVRFKNYFSFIYLFITSRKKKWRKAIFLDLLINEIHLKYFKYHKPNFSNVFYNSGAHIQHHHFLKSIFLEDSEKKSNSTSDPIYDSLYYYNNLLKDYIYNKSFDLIIFTGLNQTPNKNPTYYYRLKNHQDFLFKFNIKYKKVYPRMSRDFLIEFDDLESSKQCMNILKNIKTNNDEKIFSELDYRGKTIFATLTYKNFIDANLFIIHQNLKYNFKELVDFVAIKNGVHNEKGYLFCTKNIKKFVKIDKLNVKDVHNILIDYFKDNNAQI